MIDWLKINSLRDEIGKDDFPEVVEIFIEEVAEMISGLPPKGSRDTLGADLHALKGSALNLGFADFANLCQIGETRAANGDAAGIELEPILKCYEESKNAFLSGLENGKLT
ncbi:Hpt domain-containing protein [Sulfitobacter donghicola]|uniref:Histidine kinase n=1 Tax=Sulfitobacter donghicola DSW-25 = KCTC 12864 = JCM 14565 TaxID=1300350 RepID=A0A073IME0_9RHOB|nr:Hpt domain-containing protein [Sulfitobacter donghicola]KEJ90666.1 histidine kinase [Sulfitobacter donghicola DSW-25 = KCTC 12864 = JCM 14565]KIN67917.1 Hpt domain protein [Sulfitobacter donghicola DSW-25 = KCTC 12864 = JCM 14565]